MSAFLNRCAQTPFSLAGEISSTLYRPEIDGLRGIAVLAVVIDHCKAQLLPYGYLGVDIFFVISGFVITASLSAQRHEQASSFLLDFYAKLIDWH